MALNIQIDDDVPNEIATAVPTWLQSVLDWLIQQPPADPGRPPFYESLTFHAGLWRPNYGLQHSKRGTGYCKLQVTDILAHPTRPTARRYQSTYEEACKANWVYLCSQHRGDQSYTDEDFNHEAHLATQMRWLEEKLPDVADQIKAELRQERYESQFKEKRQLQQERQRLNRQPQQPKFYKPHYSPPPQPLGPQPAPAPITHPEPVLDEYQQRAVAQMKALQDYVLNNSVCTEGDCEDFDK